MSRHENLLIVADSERDANMLYATGLFAPDPFIFLRLRGKNFLVMSDLEIDRARARAPHCRVLSLSSYFARLQARGVRQPGLAHVVSEVLRGRKMRSAIVPDNFPLGLAAELRQLGVAVVPRERIFPGREQKTDAEVKKISEALAMAEAGMDAGVRALRRSRIGPGGRLILRGAVLTSERLRTIIDCAVLQAGGLPAHTIVAGGDQACDPHEPGHGPLRANKPIILDIFPRSQTSGYFGDITRTVVRGRATEAARRLFDVVWRGQDLAFAKIRAGTPTREIHLAVQQFFETQGYRTGRRAGRMQGFFHGTGHGLGLEIHEAPRMSATSTGALVSGQVVTVEPGLYYPGLGGVRLEDVALVGERGARNLTRFGKTFEI